MKYLILLFVPVVALAGDPMYSNDAYYEGYRQGHQLSQCGGTGYCAPNAAPAAPAPNTGMNSYESGIYRGIQDQQNERPVPPLDRNGYKGWADPYEDY